MILKCKYTSIDIRRSDLFSTLFPDSNGGTIDAISLTLISVLRSNARWARLMCYPIQISELEYLLKIEEYPNWKPLCGTCRRHCAFKEFLDTGTLIGDNYDYIMAYIKRKLKDDFSDYDWQRFNNYKVDIKELFLLWNSSSNGYDFDVIMKKFT